MRPWQFNVMFGIASFGAVLLLLGPYVGFDVNPSITQLSGYSAILAYVLGHRSQIVRKIGGRHETKKADEKEEK